MAANLGPIVNRADARKIRLLEEEYADKAAYVDAQKALFAQYGSKPPPLPPMPKQPGMPNMPRYAKGSANIKVKTKENKKFKNNSVTRLGML